MMPDLTIELRKSCPSGDLCTGEHEICLERGGVKRCETSTTGIFKFPNTSVAQYNVLCDGMPTDPSVIAVRPGPPQKYCVTSQCCD